MNEIKSTEVYSINNVIENGAIMRVADNFSLGKKGQIQVPGLRHPQQRETYEAKFCPYSRDLKGNFYLISGTKLMAKETVGILKVYFIVYRYMFTRMQILW